LSTPAKREIAEPGREQVAVSRPAKLYGRTVEGEVQHPKPVIQPTVVDIPKAGVSSKTAKPLFSLICWTQAAAGDLLDGATQRQEGVA
jgi:hypothetical protein